MSGNGSVGAEAPAVTGRTLGGVVEFLAASAVTPSKKEIRATAVGGSIVTPAAPTALGREALSRQRFGRSPDRDRMREPARGPETVADLLDELCYRPRDPRGTPLFALAGSDVVDRGADREPRVDGDSAHVRSP